MSNINDTPMRSDFSRVFIIEYRAGPANVPAYQGQARVSGVEKSWGDVEPIHAPDPTRYGHFIEVGEVPGEEERPTATIEARYPLSLSDMLRIANSGCNFDIQTHMGECQDPRDFDRGWEKILVFEKARYTSYSLDDLGAIAEGDRSAVNQEGEASAREMYEVLRMELTERAATLVNSEVVAVVVCDLASCGGDCGDETDGCQGVFAVAGPVAASPGINPEVIFSDDGLATTDNTDIDTMGATDDPDDADCVGDNLVVVSGDTDSLHYAPTDDILAGTETWTEMAVGFLGAGSPRAISSASSLFTWIVGDGGYVYYTADPTSSVTVQDAGVATAQDLADVHAFSERVIVAVGASNAVIYTVDGESWQLVVGPAAGVNLNCVFVKSTSEWWVSAANGNLYYTTDQGVNWTLKGFPGSGAGQVRAIKFATDTVGFMSHDTAAPAGRILRTVSGGNTWYVLPENPGTIPANDRMNDLAVCGDPNIVYGGGLADNGADGFLVEGSIEIS